MSKQTLYYIHDPMCSWCWGFRPVWDVVQQSMALSYPDIPIRYVLGGLAPDTHEPMPLTMQQMLQSTWQRIEQTIPNTPFNYDFWQECQPRRSTYPACRAVLAAIAQESDSENAMILAIQQAYYLQAKNPSDDDTLIACAEQIGLNAQCFIRDLHSEHIDQQLQCHIAEYRRLSLQSGASGFPSLVLSLRQLIDDDRHEERLYVIPIDYNQPQVSVDAIGKYVTK